MPADTEMKIQPEEKDVAEKDAVKEKPLPRLPLSALFRFTTTEDHVLLALSTLCATVWGSTGPIMSFLMKGLFLGIYLPNDDGTMPPVKGPHEERTKHVVESVLTFVVLAAVTFVVCSIALLGFGHVADKMVFRMRREFFKQLLRKNVGWYDSHSTAEMSTRLTNDTYDFRQGTGEKLANLIQGVIMTPAGFIVAFYQDWRLSLIMVGAVPIMAIGMGGAMRTISTMTARQQEAYGKVGGLAEMALGSIRTVAAFDGFDHECARYDEQLMVAERAGVKAGWYNGFSMGTAALIMYCTFSLGFFGGSRLLIADYKADCWKSDPPFGTCFTGATMLSTLFGVMQGAIGISQISMPMVTLAAARSAAARIYAVLDEPLAFDADAGDEPTEAQGRVDFEEVVFSYPSRLEKPALAKVSFSIPAGSTAAFIGPSGSGKSTVIGLLQRFYDIHSGAVCFDRRDIKSLSLRWLRSKMALVQQEPVLFSGSILDNIAYGHPDEATEEQVHTAAKAANAHAFISAFPHGYATEVGERGLQLSGGQKQRVAIARAMIRDPVVLMLDEATSALDNDSERVVQEALNKLMEQKARTTLMVAHRLSTVRNADQLFVLEDGCLVEQGSHDELVAKPGSLYAQLLKLQEITDNEDASPAAQNEAEAAMLTKASVGIVGDKGTTSAPGLAPAKTVEDLAAEEDNSNVKVPTSRLMGLQQKSDWTLVVIALLATVPVGAARPIMGKLFGASANAFSYPPAVLMGQGASARWVGILDTDELQKTADWNSLLFFLLGLFLWAFTAVQNGCFRQSGEALTRRVRLLSFRAMLRQEIAWFDVRSTGSLADRLATEAPLIKAFTGENLAAMLQLVTTVTLGLALAMLASWQLTLFNLVFMPLLAIGILPLLKTLKRTNDTKAGPLVSEVMGNIKTVAAFGLQDKMRLRYEELMTKESAQRGKATRASALGTAYYTSIAFLMFAGVIGIASVFIAEGTVLPDDVLQVLFPILFATSGAAMASQWSSDKAMARKALNHLFHSLDRVPPIDAYSKEGLYPAEVQGEIEFRHVAFKYPSRPHVQIFTDFNLTVAAGTTVAFVGPSGSGKSTAIALMQRFYDPEQGSVHLDGQDLRSLNLQWLRSKMALVQQEPVLFKGTVLDNIAYGCAGASEEQCKEAARSANAESFILAFPKGYATEVGERGGQISGGQKQRIAIARAMVRDPAILLLDEATSALDSESERVVQEALEKLMAQKARTTLVIAHRLSTIVGSDVICVVYQGQIVERGTHSELLQIPNGQYKQLVARQEKSP